MPLPSPRPGHPNAPFSSAGRRNAEAGRAHGLSAAVLGALVGLATACGSGSSRPRNVILISLDTLRPDHLSCYGHEPETSPNLDRLARDGVRFSDVTSVAPWTLPAHATMLTGLYPNHHGVKDHDARLSGRHITLAEEFQGAGYRTLGVVNTKNVGLPQFQLGQGFDDFVYVPEVEFAQGQNGPDQIIRNTGPQVVARAKSLLADHSKPFFLFLHFYDAHTDFTPDPEYRQRFVEPYSGDLTGNTLELSALRKNDNAGVRLLKASDLDWLRQMYDAEINQLDDLLGRFFGWLDDEGLFEDALIVITSDHGEEFAEHGSVLHGTTQYEELLRIPLIVRGPTVPSGRVIDEAVSGVDVTPMILGIMGLPSREARDGLDLSVLWRGGRLPERALFGEADHNNVVAGQSVVDIKHMVRRGAEKLHLNTATGQYELYDLEADPGELVDRLDAAPDRAEALRAELERFRSGAVAPEPVDAPLSASDRQALNALGYGEEGDQ